MLFVVSVVSFGSVKMLVFNNDVVNKIMFWINLSFFFSLFISLLFGGIVMLGDDRYF